MQAPAKTKTTILSIDGGGIRGILPGTIIAYIEERLRVLEGDEVRISDYFDLVSGTSTGGILSLLYLIPGSDGRPKFTAQQAVELYFENGDEIFKRTVWQRMKSVNGIADEKFSVSELERVLAKYFGNATLKDLLKPCLITAYDIERRQSRFFNSTDAWKGENRNFLVKSVARCTSAAPTYFETAAVQSLTGELSYLVDGGVVANNPAMCAYSEARTIDFAAHFNNPIKNSYPSSQDMFLLSIGTGEEKEPFLYEQAKDWGLVGWIRPLLDILMSANSETVDYQLKQLFNTSNPSNYFRMQPDLFHADPAMDNATHENMLALKDAAQKFVIENKAKLNLIVQKLIENKSVIKSSIS